MDRVKNGIGDIVEGIGHGAIVIRQASELPLFPLRLFRNGKLQDKGTFNAVRHGLSRPKDFLKPTAISSVMSLENGAE